MSRQTRASPLSSVNVLFLHDSNPKHEVNSLEVPTLILEQNKFQDLIPLFVEAMLKLRKVNVEPSSVLFYKTNDSLPLLDTTTWASTHINTDLDGVTTRIVHATKLSSGLDLQDLGGDFVHLVVQGELGSGDEEGENKDELGDLPKITPYKRFMGLVKKATAITPSYSAKSNERQKLQRSITSVIHDGTFTPNRDGAPVIGTIAQPIEIFCPLFGRLAKMLKDVEPDGEALVAVSSLMSTSGIIATEHKYGNLVIPKLIDALQKYIARVLTSSNSSADGLIFKIEGDALIPLLVIELKRALGEGGCDPMIQAEYSVLIRWVEKELDGIREKCRCPTLILAGGGPNLCLLGVVWTDRFIVQRLTDVVFIAQDSTCADDRLYSLARLFTAIRKGVEELSEYYDNISKQPTIPLLPDAPHPRFFPEPTSFRCRVKGGQVQFEYIRAVDDNDPTNLTYFAKTKEEIPRSVVIKFADRYGFEAHEYAAEAGYAPELYYVGLLDGKRDVLQHPEAHGNIREKAGGLYEGPLRMIVMEHLDGQDAFKTPRNEWPEDAYKHVKDAVAHLHDGDYVFGDLRPPNVVFASSSTKLVRAKLIDFDWAGAAGKVFYPPSLSQGIKWAKGVASFKKIEKGHDEEMLQLHFGPL